MLHFDTNALIALPHWAREGHPTVARVLAGEAVAVCALVWCEFLSGLLAETEAALRAHSPKDVFCQSARMPPSWRPSCSMLPAASARSRPMCSSQTAIRARAEFVTLNGADFEPFVSQGLRLFPLPA